MEHRPVGLDPVAVQAALRSLPLGGLRVLQTVGSTNDEARDWITTDAPNLALVVADEQTAGRGRQGRSWKTPSGTALALSLILEAEGPATLPSLLTGLGALAVVDAAAALGASAEIKWPNDVLLQGRKAAGVLVEAQWRGDQLAATVVGIGINVLAGSAPPDDQVRFPATSLEEALGRRTDRLQVLRAIVGALIERLPSLRAGSLVRDWASHLAYRGDLVLLTRPGQPPTTGRVIGLDDDGSLRLQNPGGMLSVQTGEIRLAPGDVRMD